MDRRLFSTEKDHDIYESTKKQRECKCFSRSSNKFQQRLLFEEELIPHNYWKTTINTAAAFVMPFFVVEFVYII